MFRVGQKVVCVDAEDTDTTGLREIFEGRIYTLCWVGMYDDGAEEYLCVQLAGVLRLFNCNIPEAGFSDMPFNARRFRPLVSTSKKSERQKTIDKMLADGMKQPERV